MQAVKGYLSNGRFTPIGEVFLPNHAEVVLVFASEPLVQHTAATQKSKRQLGFLKDKLPPLPESFFDPLPEEDLQAWGL